MNSRRASALSTGQAARYCFVSPGSILNWIRDGRIRAQRTAGGQYRIRLDVFRSFMIDNGMSTDLLDEEKGIRPFCWEFHCEGGPSPADQLCKQCLVRKSITLDCFSLRHLLDPAGRRQEDCERCEYYRIWSREDNEDQES